MSGFTAPAAYQRLATPARRLAAFVIDAGVIAVPLLPVGLALPPDAFVTIPVAELAYLAYFTLAWSHIGRGRTIGGHALGIQVIDGDAKPLTVPLAALRCVTSSFHWVLPRSEPDFRI